MTLTKIPLVLCAAAAAAQVAFAQAPADEPSAAASAVAARPADFGRSVTVADVRVQANDNFGVDPTDAVLAMCSVKAGMSATEPELGRYVSADVKALLATPDYSDVSTRIGKTDKGDWVVIYIIARRPQLAEAPAYAGVDEVMRLSKAEEAVKLNRNDRIDDSIASAAAQRLRAKLQHEGFVNAKVSYELRYADAPGYAYLTLLAVPGDERKIRDYLFEGNTVYEHDELAAAFGWKPAYNPLSWFMDFPLSDEKLDDARTVVNDKYTAAGYLDAEVSGPELRPIEGREAGHADAVFTVDEGPLYTVGTVTVTGAKVYDNSALEAAARKVLAERGRTATADTLEAVRKAVVDYYGSRGYVDTYATVTQVPRIDGAVIDLSYSLIEGEQARIREIRIQGNSVTQDKVIRRELVIQPGELYDSRLIERSKKRLENLNYFQKESGVNAYTVKTAEKGERDLVFDVREDRTGEYGLGVGVSSVDSVFVYARATQRNFDLFNPSNGFRGGGQRASAGAEIGSRRQTAEVSWTQPWLFDMPLSFTVDAYRKLRWFDHYDEIRTGAAFTLSWKPEPIPTPWGDAQLDRIGLRYTLENVEYDDEDEGVWYTADGNRPFSFTNQEDGLNSKLRFFWQENHRNRPFVPTSGWESMVYAEVGFFGEAKDYGIGFNVTKWWNPWKDHVLMTRFRADAVEAYSGDVPMFDRFFIGGGRTVRGYEFRDGGPKAWANGEHVAIGGQTMWCGTLEYSIPLVSALRFAVFTDFGAADKDFLGTGDELMWSVGCGLRLDLPGFPIRLDIAKPLTDDDTDEETFTFWIGID